MSDKTTYILGPDAPHVRKALDEHLDNLAAPIRWKVTTEPYKANRSAAQNQLLWMWNTQIGKHLGYSKDEIHEIAKEKYAVPIFTRDDPDYAAMVNAVKEVRKQHMDIEADTLKKKIVALTSTTDFNVSQMSEYLNHLEHFAAENGAALTFPDDLMNQALGKRK